MATFLVPPGMGDIYWSLTKIKGIAEKDNIDKIDIVIFHDASRRSEAFPGRFTMVNSSRMGNANETRGKKKKNEPLHHDFDYLVWYNNVLEEGKYLDTDIFPDINTDWYPEMNHSCVEEAFGIDMKEQYQDYVVMFYVEPNRMYKLWREYVDYPTIYSLCKKIKHYFGYNILIMGMEWDRKSFNALKSLDTDNIIIDMLGKTNVDKLFGLLKNAKAIIGDSAGNVMMGNYFKIPTFMFWSDDKFTNKNFFLNTAPPDSLGKWYYPICVKQYKEDEILNGMETINQRGYFYEGTKDQLLQFFKEKLNV